MDISIDNEAVRTAISGKIIEALSLEQRTSIVQQAVNQLLEEKTTDYGSRKIPSPIQQAFNTAVRAIAQEVVDEYLAQPEVRALVREQIAVGTAQFFKNATSPGSLASAIADGIENVVRDQVYARS